MEQAGDVRREAGENRGYRYAAKELGVLLGHWNLVIEHLIPCYRHQAVDLQRATQRPVPSFGDTRRPPSGDGSYEKYKLTR